MQIVGQIVKTFGCMYTSNTPCILSYQVNLACSEDSK